MALVRTTTRARGRRAFIMAIACSLAFGVVTTEDTCAHGFAGKRFFPATLVTEDPFVADELSLPTISYRKVPGEGDGPAARETDFSVDMSKRITENFGVGFGATYKQVQPDGGDTQRGFDNLAASVKYKFYQSDEHETIRNPYWAAMDRKRPSGPLLADASKTRIMGAGLVLGTPSGRVSQ